MVVLWVILEDLRLFLVVEVPYKLVHAELFPPFLTLYEPATHLAFESRSSRSSGLHLLCKLDIELPCTKESQLAIIRR